MTKLVVASLTVLLLGCCSLIHTAAAAAKYMCGNGVNTYADFPYNLKVVLKSLATDTTPTGYSYIRYYPDKTTAGSAWGRAKCHTVSEKECRRCLGDARDRLGSCERRMAGTYAAGSCHMVFLQVKLY